MVFCQKLAEIDFTEIAPLSFQNIINIIGPTELDALFNDR